MNIAIDPGRGRERALLGPLCIAALCSLSGASHAVENIRNVTWNHAQGIAWDPQKSAASVTFDADLTPLEAAYQITSFSVAVVHAVGSPVTLYRAALGPLSHGAVGSTARFQIDVSMSCDPVTKRLSVHLERARMDYLHPTIGATSLQLSDGGPRVTASSRESIGLAILDQDGLATIESLPGDTFACLNGPDEPNQGTVGVYFDPAGTQCSGTIPGGTVGKVYVVAKLAGPTAGGIAGAEFRFEGMPSAWEAYSVPDPQILALGDPFADGVVMGFECKSAQEHAVLLYTVIVFAHDDISDVLFQILMRSPPLSSQCPLLLTCDAPVFTKYCVEGLPCFVNSRKTPPCATPLAVQSASWSVVKGLYR
jgi:hypothetical protein